MQEVMVSIICRTYNHEKHIAEALDGFLNQETEYPYEILINEDASTDHTADIVREYENKHPDKIFPIYQKVNQNGKQNTTLLLMSKARGKYFAICEGDDCWIDPHKLQKQIHYMEEHPDCTLCVHNAIQVTEDGKRLTDIVLTEEDGIIPAEEFIKGGGAHYCATASIVGRMEHAIKVPDFYRNCSLDYAWQIYLAACGYAYCFKDRMSLYRVAVSGSWTERMERDPSAYARVYGLINKMLKEFDEWSGGRFHDTVRESIAKHTYLIGIRTNDRSVLKDEDVKKWIQSQSKSFKAKHILWKYAPGVYNKLRNYRLKKRYGFDVKK